MVWFFVSGFFPTRTWCLRSSVSLCVVVICSPSLLHRVRIDHDVFFPSMTESHLNCFQWGDTMRSAAINILVHVVSKYMPFSVGQIPRFPPLKKEFEVKMYIHWTARTLRVQFKLVWPLGSFKVRHRSTQWPNSSTPRCLSKINENIRPQKPHTKLFITALSTIPSAGKQPRCPSAGEQRNKLFTPPRWTGMNHWIIQQRDKPPKWGGWKKLDTMCPLSVTF